MKKRVVSLFLLIIIAGGAVLLYNHVQRENTPPPAVVASDAQRINEQIVTIQSQVQGLLLQVSEIVLEDSNCNSEVFEILERLQTMEDWGNNIQEFITQVELLREEVAEMSNQLPGIVNQIAELSNSIAQLQTELAEIDYVVAWRIGLTGIGYTNGWYRKYKSGWVEQGGIANASATPMTVHLPYANVIKYTLLITPVYTGTLTAAYVPAASIEADKFVLYIPQTGPGIHFEVKGMAA